jgi:hypothetical protein
MNKNTIIEKNLTPYKSKVIVYFTGSNNKTTCKTGLYVDLKDNALVILNKCKEIEIALDKIISVVAK